MSIRQAQSASGSRATRSKTGGAAACVRFMRFWYRWAIRFRGRYMAVAVKWFALRAGVEKTRGKTRREDLRGAGGAV